MLFKIVERVAVMVVALLLLSVALRAPSRDRQQNRRQAAKAGSATRVAANAREATAIESVYRDPR